MTRKTSIVLGAAVVLLTVASAGTVSADTARHPADGTLRVQGREVHVDPAVARRITTGHGTASDYRAAGILPSMPLPGGTRPDGGAR
ncbi:hypothetical protein ACFV0O_29320 [Kitasatospora sp. NPDC059577]|uniref:hypothetical protein n=1 Tax=unclassified Kitasatospora TaxID=2633591 RepID=UPI0036BF1A79